MDGVVDGVVDGVADECDGVVDNVMVLEAIHALRRVVMPEVAQVAGSNTIADLSTTLLEARLVAGVVRGEGGRRGELRGGRKGERGGEGEG